MPFCSAIQAPVPPGVTAMPTTGEVTSTGEDGASGAASPKLKTLPSASASQYPPPSGVAAIATMRRPGV